MESKLMRKKVKDMNEEIEKVQLSNDIDEEEK